MSVVFRLVGRFLVFALVSFASFAAIAIVTNLVLGKPPTWLPVSALGLSLVGGLLVALRVGRKGRLENSPLATSAATVATEKPKTAVPQVSPSATAKLNEEAEGRTNLPGGSTMAAGHGANLEASTPVQSGEPATAPAHNMDALSAPKQVTPKRDRPIEPLHVQASRGRFKLNPTGIAVLGVGGFLIAAALNGSAVTALAKSFVYDHQGHLGGSYLVTRVDVPLTALLSSSYEISVTLQKTDTEDAFSVLRPRIDGNCLFGDCSISMRRWELLGL